MPAGAVSHRVSAMCLAKRPPIDDRNRTWTAPWSARAVEFPQVDLPGLQFGRLTMVFTGPPHAAYVRRCGGGVSRACGVVLVLAGLGTAAVTSAAENLPRLVRQLGAEAFSQRQSAHRQILDEGPSVLPYLEEAAEESDPEVRHRIGRLVGRLRDIRNEALLSELLRDPQRPAPVGLPAWSRYVILTGDSQASRLLYRDMLRADADILAMIESGEAVASLQDQLDAGIGVMRMPRSNLLRTMSREQVALLVFSAVEAERQSGAVLSMNLPELLDQARVPQTAPQDPTETEDPVRRLVAAWVVSPEVASQSDRMRIGVSYNLPEAMQPARDVLLDAALTGLTPGEQPVPPPPNNLREILDAILTIARFGGPEQIPLLEPFLRDPRGLHQLRHRQSADFESRVQDVVLLTLVHITGQRGGDYRFDPKKLGEDGRRAVRPAAAGGAVRPAAAAGAADATDEASDATARPAPPAWIHSPQSIGFEQDEDRQLAIRQWRRWRAIHLHSPLFSPLDAVEGITL